MENAINSVISFLILYLIYYYALRFIQILFQSSISCISKIFSHAFYVISTPAHEIAHLIMALICFARIQEVKLFPSKNEPGHVRYAIGSKYNFVKDIKNFFIAIGPALINIPLFIFIEAKYVLKINNYDISRILEPRFLLSKEGIITLILFIVLISGIAPSYADFKGMFKGLIVFSIFIFVIGYLTGSFFDIRNVKVSSLVSLVIYYGEIILTTLILNIIVHYRNWFSVLTAIFKSSIKQTISKS